jgi:hypothetical protein
MMAWLSHGNKWKDKEKGTVYGPSHLRKYLDAGVQSTPAACICLKLIRNIVEGNATIIALIEKDVASIPKLVRESISESINATAA